MYLEWTGVKLGRKFKESIDMHIPFIISFIHIMNLRTKKASEFKITLQNQSRDILSVNGCGA